jgi:hypothetical protein
MISSNDILYKKKLNLLYLLMNENNKKIKNELGIG